MKLEPIRNPHSKLAMVEKKTKFMEKEELIGKTKMQTIAKYGVRSALTPRKKLRRPKLACTSQAMRAKEQT